MIKPTRTFFFDDPDFPIMDSFDPSESYDPFEIEAFDIGPIKNDMYGKVYGLAKQRLVQMARRISSTVSLALNIYCVDVRVLPRHLEYDSFARIEVSNITDDCWLGTRETLSIFRDYLQTPYKNEHAAIISLYINLGRERDLDAGSKLPPARGAIFQKYLEGRGVTPLTISSMGEYSADKCVYIVGSTLLKDNEAVFEK